MLSTLPWTELCDEVAQEQGGCAHRQPTVDGLHPVKGRDQSPPNGFQGIDRGRAHGREPTLVVIENGQGD